MAGTILSSIMKLATEKLSLLIGAPPTLKSPTQLFPGVGEEEDQLKELKETMEWIQDVLDNSEEKDINLRSDRLRLKEIQDLAYDAEDVAEEYDVQLLRSKLEARAQMEVAVIGHKRKSDSGVQSSLNYNHAQVLASPDMRALACRIREIRERFDEITRVWENLRLPEKLTKKRRIPQRKPEKTGSLYDPSTVFGREDEKQKLVNFLLPGEKSADSNGSVSVLPVVGMGGIGKTTLARLVYNDPAVVSKFDLRAWICVSEEFEVVSLIRNIVNSFLDSKVDYTDTAKLQDTLTARLRGKRFLLVLDDVWNDKPNLWEPVRTALLTSGVGTVLVTTRNLLVANVMQTMPPLNLGELPFAECWKLFKKIAFAGLNENDVPHLLEIGQKIVDKCRGLPLAVKVLGGILRWESHEEAWTIVLESELWQLDHENDEVLPALKLSYDHMPAHLKRCFMYLSLFPKDYNFVKEDTINVWMSQGLLQPDDTLEPEDIGDDYIDELLQRSILQKSKSEEKCLEMHDLIHDLARSVAREGYSMIKVNELSSPPKGVRHLAVELSSKDELTSDLNSLRDAKILRTLISVRNNDKSYWWRVIFRIPGELLLNLKCIRTLDFRYTGIEELPESIDNLIQLRYLCIKHTKIITLPESVSNLYNLQTLDLDMEFQKLPVGIGKLFNLRHLMLPHPYVCMPSGIGKLTNLQTLLNFNVGKDGFHCGIGELKNLANLRGTLTINWLDNASRSQISHLEAYLKNTKGLVRLELNWRTYSNRECLHLDNMIIDNENKSYSQEGMESQPSIADEQIADQVLESLQPHSNIKELDLYYYTGSRFPRWLGDASFFNLSNVYLSYCSEPSFLPPLGQLPGLRDLTIQAMGNVQYIDREFCGEAATMAFPSLKSLSFYNLSRWEEWRGLQEGDFPCLHRLSLNRCPKMRQLPSCLLSSIKELLIEFCDVLTTLTFPETNLISSLTLAGRWNPEMFCSSQMSMLENLVLSYSSEGSFFLPAQNLPSLKRITAFKCSSLTSLLGLANLTALESLDLSSCFSIQIEQLPPMLQEVRMSACNSKLEKWCEEQILRRKNQILEIAPFHL